MAGLRGRDVYRDRRWEPARLVCFSRFGYRCARCHRPGLLECHHKVKLVDGGAPFAQSNLEPRCKTCHFREHAADVPVSAARHEWREFMEGVAHGVV